MVHTVIIHVVNDICIVHTIIVYNMVVVDVVVDAAVERFDPLAYSCCNAAGSCCDCDVTVERFDPLIL